jgi:1-acyl-sn-glycerol-3-phosphate acyltransferase
VIGAGVLGVPNRPNGIYDRVPRLWSRIALWAAGVRLELHGDEQLRLFKPRVFVSNHVSWYDIFTLLSILPRYRFVATAELFKIPLFGPAARRAGTIPIQRETGGSVPGVMRRHEKSAVVLQWSCVREGARDSYSPAIQEGTLSSRSPRRRPWCRW